MAGATGAAAEEDEAAGGSEMLCVHLLGNVPAHAAAVKHRKVTRVVSVTFKVDVLRLLNFGGT